MNAIGSEIGTWIATTQENKNGGEDDENVRRRVVIVKMIVRVTFGLSSNERSNFLERGISETFSL